ncbi:MAG TPA: PASTA domain-containing protein [Pyrinomonadaceae bacterium]|nr:PASTA domain-containing protein [Pyrinomonadaceae bacterium]
MAVEDYGLSALRKVLIIIAIAIAFLFGLTGTVYLSLRSSEVHVPDITGKEYSAGESALETAGLHIRKRALRPSADRPPNIILDQVPHAGEVVKVGQTVAVDVTRAPNEGESGYTAPQTQGNGNGQTGGQGAGEASGTTPAPLNENENQNRPRRPRNTNTNSNSNANRNANNSNALNTNAGGKGNANEHNANSTRNTNANRAGGNLNSNRHVPQISTPPFNP